MLVAGRGPGDVSGCRASAENHSSSLQLFRGIPLQTIAAAEPEAAAIYRPVVVEIEWMDCDLLPDEAT